MDKEWRVVFEKILTDRIHTIRKENQKNEEGGT